MRDMTCKLTRQHRIFDWRRIRLCDPPIPENRMAFVSYFAFRFAPSHASALSHFTVTLFRFAWVCMGLYGVLILGARKYPTGRFALTR